MSIILDHVNYIYDEDGAQAVCALRDINLVIPHGQFIGVIGQTGSGKSTLMQMLNGLLQPTSGMVLFDGEDIADKDFDRKRLRSKVGMVFQYPEYQLFESTVFNDVCFGPLNMGMSRKEAQLAAYQALRDLHFPEELYYQSPFLLSGGQKRRAAIAGVLAMNPEFLVLDEPAAGLDPKGRDEILQRVAALQHSANKTVLLVSHSMEDVAQYADRLLVLHKGTIVMDDTPAHIFARIEELETIGLAVPKISYLMRDLQKRGIPVRSGSITIEEAKKEILRTFRAGKDSI